MYRIMIVEDDEVISREICAHIESWGYECRCVEDFRRVLEEFNEYLPQLVLLDITLPFYNGYHWCAEIRKISSVPILFVSSASDNMNIVMAINMGGDDFVSKPFDLNVLTAKISAIMRRTYEFAQSAKTTMSVQGVTLDIEDATMEINGEKIELTKNEQRILQVLMENAGKLCSRDLLMNKLWESDSFIDDNTLSVNVARLRKKIKDAGLTDFIKTKKGLGYMVE